MSIRIHGHNGRAGKSPTYNSWDNMLARCTRPSCPTYADYGGRGIAVCKRWRSFARFLSDMGERPEGKTLDRRNARRGYSPGNCKWSTPREQAAHMSRNIHITIGTETHILREWSRILGINRETLRYRYHKGEWPC